MSTCLTCMGSQVRVLYCPPSSRTKKDIYAKNPEVSTASGFFCAHFLKLEKKISKRVLAKSVDLNLYPRDFGPLFRGLFGKAARFRSRQNVEFRPTFLVALPNTHSKHRCQRVSRLCGISDVKAAGKPPIPLQDETTAYWRCWDARKQSTRCQRCSSGWSFICWISAEHRFLMSHPSCPYHSATMSSQNSRRLSPCSHLPRQTESIFCPCLYQQSAVFHIAIY